MLLDSHSHHTPPYPEGIISISPLQTPFPNQPISVGIHPWCDTPPDSDTWKSLRYIATLPLTLAIGEAGIDTMHGTLPLAMQMQILFSQASLANELGLPMIIHDVKAHQEIISIRKEINPSRPWIIHGFRSKPSVARMLLDSGCLLSFGEHFNPLTIRYVPEGSILAETDESQIPVARIIQSLSQARGADLLPLIIRNTQTTFLTRQ